MCPGGIKMKDRIFKCPGCFNYSNMVKLQKIEFESHISIMCWDICGMDFDVNYMWFWLNSWVDEDE